MLLKIFQSISCILLSFCPCAQDISGIWTGVIKTAGSEVPYEIVISGTKDYFRGYSLTAFTFNGVQNLGVKSIRVKSKNKIINIEDDELLFNNYTTPPKRVKLFANLFLKTSDSLMVLNGTFTTRTIDFRDQDTKPFTGTIRLQKLKAIKQTLLITMLEEMNLLHDLSFLPQNKIEDILVVNKYSPSPATKLATTKNQNNSSEPRAAIKQKHPPVITKDSAMIIKRDVATSTGPAAEMAQRQTEIIRRVHYHSDSLVLRIYDNGIIDGDTISVVFNGRVILSKIALTASPVSTIIKFTPQMADSVQLLMYAENLGAIPPNTGVLVIEDGNEKTTIRFAGDLRKNSAVIFSRNP